MNPCLLCARYARWSTHTISCNAHHKQPGEVGTAVFLSDEGTGPERLGDLPEVTQLVGRGSWNYPDRPVPDLALAPPGK